MDNVMIPQKANNSRSQSILALKSSVFLSDALKCADLSGPIYSHIQ